MKKIAQFFRRRVFTASVILAFSAIFTLQSVTLPVHVTQHEVQHFSKNQGSHSPLEDEKHEKQCQLCVAFHQNFLSIAIHHNVLSPELLISSVEKITDEQFFSLSILSASARAPPILSLLS